MSIYRNWPSSSWFATLLRGECNDAEQPITTLPRNIVPVLVRGCGRCDQHKHLAPSRFADAQRGTAAATGDRSALAQRGARRAARVAAGVGTEDGCTDATRWPEGAGPKIGPRVRWTRYCVSVVAVTCTRRRYSLYGTCMAKSEASSNLKKRVCARTPR